MKVLVSLVAIVFVVLGVFYLSQNHISEPLAPMPGCERSGEIHGLSHHRTPEQQESLIQALSLCRDPVVLVFYRQVFLSKLANQMSVLNALENRTNAGIFEMETLDFLSGWLHAPQKKKDPAVERRALLLIKKMASLNPEAWDKFSQIRARCALWDLCSELNDDHGRPPSLK